MVVTVSITQTVFEFWLVMNALCASARGVRTNIGRMFDGFEVRIASSTGLSNGKSPSPRATAIEAGG
jgi:hypothetical protein